MQKHRRFGPRSVSIPNNHIYIYIYMQVGKNINMSEFRNIVASISVYNATRKP